MERIRELLGQQPTQRERRRVPRPVDDRDAMRVQIAIYRARLRAIDARVDAQRRQGRAMR